jgi:uncharacterized protein YyaL (SSP411 family)
MAESLVRLGRYTGDGKYAEAVTEELESWADELGTYGELSAPFGMAVDRLLRPPLEVIVVGDPGKDDTEAIRKEARALYHPWKVMVYRSMEEAPAELAPRQLNPVEAAACFVCLAERCTGPVETGSMGAALESFLQSARK